MTFCSADDASDLGLRQMKIRMKEGSEFVVCDRFSRVLCDAFSYDLLCHPNQRNPFAVNVRGGGGD